MTSINDQILDIGEAFGTDCDKFLRCRAFFVSIEEIALTPYHKNQLECLELLEALELVFNAVKKIG